MEEKLFDLIGLGLPFGLAAATYAVFAGLDSNASDEATKVISSWLHGRSHNKPDLGNLIIKAFDRLYTSPLLTFKAFRRSATISITIWVLAFLIPSSVRLFPLLRQFADSIGWINFVIPYLTLSIVILVMTDYGSLFFVRRFLNLARAHPMSASILSSIVGVIVVTISYIGSFEIVSLLMVLTASQPGTTLAPFWTFLSSIAPFLFAIMPAAFIIHLWLPLFALASLAVKFIFLIFRAVEWAQWFLKQGDAHPLKAIGIVATIIVFGSAMLVKEGWAVLSVLERS